MRLQSLIFDGNYHTAIEVELTLWPGLPGIQFLGLPDQHIKESAARIKSAIKSQGFEFPRSKQIYVNLRPNYLKKSSKGLELAVAAAYLMETGQIPIPDEHEQIFFFGELDLSGKIYFPKEKIQFQFPYSLKMISANTGPQQAEMFISEVKELQDLKKEQVFFKQKSTQKNMQRPALQSSLSFSKKMGKLMKVSAVGNHSLLLAGAAGSGKTTFAKILHSLLPYPNHSESIEILSDDPNLNWRPLISPHHSTPMMSLIGGGNKVMKGEIARAHRGVLLLDEFLEFDPDVIETLREPLEEKKMRVARAGQVVEFPCESLVVATTNLCPCGQWTPENKKSISCRLPARRCRSKLDRLSGPILDRFQMLAFINETTAAEESLLSIQKDIDEAMAFRKMRLEKESEQTEADVQKINQLELLLPDSRGSLRRRNATLGVARTIADLEKSQDTKPQHLKEAMEFTFFPFQKISYHDLD